MNRDNNNWNNNTGRSDDGTLLGAYMDIANNTVQWNYYMYNNRGSDLCINEKWKSEDAAFSFIKSYYGAGGKSVLLEANDILDGIKNNDRNSHAVSLYLLGILLYSTLKFPGNSKKRNMRYDTKKYHNFLFKWFLACLYHDVGYVYEKEKHYYDSCKNLDVFLEELEIKKENNLLEGVYKNGKKRRYYRNKQLVYNYYLYTLNERKRLDHGIAGGLLLYKNLIEMYNRIANEKAHKATDIIEDGLLYSPELFDQYQIAADAIARHNIWMVNIESKLDREETIEKRRQIFNAYQLDELIINDSKRETLNEENLIWFLLCFADSIEPVKVYNTVKPEEVLRNIKINITATMIEFDFTHSVLKPELLYKKARDLQDWLNVEIVPDVDTDKEDCPKVFSITLNP